MAQVAAGKVCPNRSGGYVFTGRLEIGAGTGRFSEISTGQGRVLVTIATNGSVTLILAGHFRTS